MSDKVKNRVDSSVLFVASGRRKTAVARVCMKKGSGNVIVNGKKMEDYFVLPLQQNMVRSPIELFKSERDFVVTAGGGGVQAQAEAVRHGIARSLVKEDGDRRPLLREKGYLTRDPRKKERKKYGLAGARKSFQFSKR